MFKRLFQAGRASRAEVATVPPGQRVYAVGDVHGRLDLLVDLLERIAADDAGRGDAVTRIIFLGDLVDRGPDSAAVIEQLRLLAAARSGTHFLMGNHEEVFLAALGGDLAALRGFARIGGRDTMLSYGIGDADYHRMSYEELAEAMRTRVPPAHAAFIAGFEDTIVIGDYAFVHAGIHPARPLAEQRVEDLRWIRAPFLDHNGLLEKTIVHGHTISEDVMRLPHRIGIDTGAYQTGRLTALGIEGDTTWILQTAGAEARCR